MKLNDNIIHQYLNGELKGERLAEFNKEVGSCSLESLEDLAKEYPTSIGIQKLVKIKKQLIRVQTQIADVSIEYCRRKTPTVFKEKLKEEQNFQKQVEIYDEIESALMKNYLDLDDEVYAKEKEKLQPIFDEVNEKYFKVQKQERSHSKKQDLTELFDGKETQTDKHQLSKFKKSTVIKRLLPFGLIAAAASLMFFVLNPLFNELSQIELVNNCLESYDKSNLIEEDNFPIGFTLNSEIGMDYPSHQVIWLENQLAYSNSIWKFAKYQKPIRSNFSNKIKDDRQCTFWSPFFYKKNDNIVLEGNIPDTSIPYPIISYNTECYIIDSFKKGSDNGTVYAGHGTWGKSVRFDNNTQNKSNIIFQSLRFSKINIPKNATIKSASLTYKTNLGYWGFEDNLSKNIHNYENVKDPIQLLPRQVNLNHQNSQIDKAIETSQQNAKVDLANQFTTDCSVADIAFQNKHNFDKIFHANNTITSNANVLANIEYKASEEVTLGPGFSTNNQFGFSITIEGCN